MNKKKKGVIVSLVLMVVAVIAIMVESYRIRGYFALGSEVIMVPLWLLVTYMFAVEVEE